MQKVTALSFLIISESQIAGDDVCRYLCHTRGVPIDQVFLVNNAQDVFALMEENVFDVIFFMDNVDFRGMENIKVEGQNQAHHAGLRLALHLQKVIKKESLWTRLAYLWVQDYHLDYLGSLRAAVEPDGFVHQVVPGELVAAMEEVVYWAIGGGYHLIVSKDDDRPGIIGQLLSFTYSIPERFFLTAHTVEQALDVVDKYPEQLQSVMIYEHAGVVGGERISIDPSDGQDQYWAGVSLAKYLKEFFSKNKWNTRICFAYGACWNGNDQTMLPDVVGENGLILEFAADARAFAKSFITWLYKN